MLWVKGENDYWAFQWDWTECDDRRAALRIFRYYKSAGSEGTGNAGTGGYLDISGVVLDIIEDWRYYIFVIE